MTLLRYWGTQIKNYFDRPKNYQKLAPVTFLVFIIFTSKFAHGFGVSGYVYTRGMITNEQQIPYWAEYNPDTGELLESGALGLASGEWSLDAIYPMPASTYRQYVDQFEGLKTQFEGDGEILKLGKDEFDAASFALMDGTPFTPQNSLSVLDGTNFIILAPPADNAGGQYRYFSDDISQIVLAQMPVDPEDEPSQNSKSLLIQYEGGDIKYQTANNIGFRTAFFSKEGELVQSEELFRDREDKIWGPIAGARTNFRSYTGSDGQYFLATY